VISALGGKKTNRISGLVDGVGIRYYPAKR
jgi:hypothetical protein